MGFEFIDNNTLLDSATRQRVRKHAATGKNVGRKLSRPSKRKSGWAKPAAQAKTVIDEPLLHRGLRNLNKPENPEEESSGSGFNKIERQIDGGLTFELIPTNEPWTPRSRRVVQRMFRLIGTPPSSPGLDRALDYSAWNLSMWRQMIFRDEAYFHCAVAVSIISINNMSTEPEDPAEALSHLSKSSHLVNQRIAEGKADATSDGTMAVIVIMSKYGLTAGHAQQGPTHLDGLQRMVELRGGMTTLTDYNPSMAQKIFRADLEWSLCLGCATRFRIDDVERRSTATIGRSRLFGGPRDRTKDGKTRSVSSQPVKRLSSGLEELLVDSRELACMLNEASVGRRSKIDNYTMQDTVILLGYRLIHQCPLSRVSLLTHVEKSVHIGLTAFLRTFLVGLDGKVAENILLTQLVISIASQEEEPGEDDQTIKNTEELVLWVLLIAVAAAAIGSVGDDCWLMPRLERIVNALDLQNVEDVLQVVSKFPWMYSLHDKAAHEVWRRFIMYKRLETTSNAPFSTTCLFKFLKGDHA